MFDGSREGFLHHFVQSKIRKFKRRIELLLDPDPFAEQLESFLYFHQRWVPEPQN